MSAGARPLGRAGNGTTIRLQWRGRTWRLSVWQGKRTQSRAIWQLRKEEASPISSVEGRPSHQHYPRGRPCLTWRVVMAWAVLFTAGLLEIGWAIGLKYTEGFTRLAPSVLTLAAMAGSIILL